MLIDVAIYKNKVIDYFFYVAIEKIKGLITFFLSM